MTSHFIAKVRPELGLASLSEPTSGMRVVTVPQQWGKKHSAEVAYASARFSRSKEGIETILEDIQSKSTDGNARLEKIIHSYGHASVMGLGSILVFIENIPLWLAARIHYLLPPQYMSQEASTRYIDFGQPLYSAPTANPDVINVTLKHYEKLKQPTYDYLRLHYRIDESIKSEKTALEARTFDCLRYLLPVSLCTSLSLNTDARVLSGLIAQLTDGDSLEVILGNLLRELMQGNKELASLGYIPEADGLIRHTEKTTGKYESDTDILYYLNSVDHNGSRLVELDPDDCIATFGNLDEDLIENYLMLCYPSLYLEDSKFTNNVKANIGIRLAEYHNRHRGVGNKALTTGLSVQGKMDFGSLRDFNRHRSLNKVIPLLERVCRYAIEPEYTLCPYLQPDTQLYEMYDKAMKEIYRSLLICSPRLQKYNIPLGHSTRYKFSGNLDAFAYTTELRSRCGGHIAYRKYAWDWHKELIKHSLTYSYMANKLVPVCVNSREQFLDRS